MEYELFGSTACEKWCSTIDRKNTERCLNCWVVLKEEKTWWGRKTEKMKQYFA